MDRLKSKSGNEFESGKERFKEARKTATHAFYNEGLIVKDRIFAAKLRECVRRCLSVSKALKLQSSGVKRFFKISIVYQLSVKYFQCSSKADRCKLDFLEATGHLVNIAFNNMNDIVMIKGDAPNSIYVCDNTGQLKFQFQRESYPYPRVSMNISNENEIIISANVRNRAIQIYTVEGKLKKVINLPEEHRVVGVAFHQFIFKIFVLSFEYKTASYFLLCYSATGDLESSTFFSEWTGKRFRPRPNIVSNQNVPIAVVCPREIVNKTYCFLRTQSISILLYTKSQRNDKLKRTTYENTLNILFLKLMTLNLIWNTAMSILSKGRVFT